MNRPIKFRAWDGKKLFPVQGLTFAYGEPIVIENIGENYKEDLEVPGIVMQFTGLLDKNGKEIYEGDVLSLPKRYNYDPSNGDNPIELLVVEYIYGAFCIGGDYLNEWEPNIEIEIIGNIYENPELIEISK